MSTGKTPSPVQAGPLKSLEEWDDFVAMRYAENPNEVPAIHATDKAPDQFRDYSESTPARVREFYRQNHTFQTCEFVRQKKQEFLAKNHARMGIWEAMEFLNTLVDESDPDTELSQIEHLLQTSEAIRRDSKSGLRAHGPAKSSFTSSFP